MACHLQEPLPFEGQSSYAADYPPKQAQPAAPSGMVPATKPLPFEGQSTYQGEFVPKKGEIVDVAYVPVARTMSRPHPPPTQTRMVYPLLCAPLFTFNDAFQQSN